MRFYKFVLFLITVLLLSACGGGDGYDDSYASNNVTYIDWTGSVNGTLVVDASDDVFEFEVITGYLSFGNTTYTNAWVDSFGDFYIDSELIGAVYYVKSIYNETITALISNNGYYIDIYGPESNLAWSETSTLPIYALKGATVLSNQQSIYAQIAQQKTVNASVQATPPETSKNAYTESLPKNNRSILNK